ncbi:MAG: malate synthase A [Myxococcales bacterium]|nr:malate synthase A [Myxococcales bacterium]
MSKLILWNDREVRVTRLDVPDGVRILGSVKPGYARVLSEAALRFLADLHRRFEADRQALLEQRRGAQRAYDHGELPDFDPATASIRDDDWTIAALPADLLDRRVEITGPVDRKMVINALNCGARCFMADFEDATSPTWSNLVEGQHNLMDAVRRSISFVHPNTGKHYALVDDPAVLLVRPRGLHLEEAHVEVDGQRLSASLFDFGLYFFHNAVHLLATGSGPYLYLPKLEHHAEAHWWNNVFTYVQQAIDVPHGSIKATVLIETLPAAFQLDEILWALRDHSAGLNCGRWDYIFSYIKTLRAHGGYLTPDRGHITMTQPFMAAYTARVVSVCHRRGAPAMGGMAAQIPIKGDRAANEAAFERVRADKEREARLGHDGTWVAHPGLVPIAQHAFDVVMPGPNQIGHRRPAEVTQADLLQVPRGPRTEEGLRINVRVALQYLAAWLSGSGCVPLYGLMEDAATAEISRTQLWQWIHHRAELDDGRMVTLDLFRRILDDELGQLRPDADGAVLDAAARLFEALVTDERLHSFLTLPAYEQLRQSPQHVGASS